MSFKGIGIAISKLTRRPTEGDTIERLLEKSMPSIVESITTTRLGIIKFGVVVEDHNPIHLLENKAEKVKLKTTPIMGVHTLAFAEQFAQRVIDTINKENNKENNNQGNLLIRGIAIKFKDFAYPEESIRWGINGYEQTKDESISLNIEGKVKGVNIATVSAKIGLRYFEKKPLPPDKKPLPLDKIIFSTTYAFDQERFDDFKECIGANGEPYPLTALPGLFIPSTLLKLLRERTLKMTGINSYMDLNYFNKPDIGKSVRVDIYSYTRPPRKISKDPDPEQYLYSKIKATCSQGQKLLIAGDITCIV